MGNGPCKLYFITLFYVCLHVCAHVCAIQRSTAGVSLSYSLPLFLDRGSLIDPRTHQWASEVHLSLMPPHWEFTDTCCCTQLLWVLGFKLGSSCLHSHHFTNWVISTASIILFLRQHLNYLSLLNSNPQIEVSFLLQPPEWWGYRSQPHSTLPDMPCSIVFLRILAWKLEDYVGYLDLSNRLKSIIIKEEGEVMGEDTGARHSAHARRNHSRALVSHWKLHTSEKQIFSLKSSIHEPAFLHFYISDKKLI